MLKFWRKCSIMNPTEEDTDDQTQIYVQKRYAFQNALYTAPRSAEKTRSGAVENPIREYSGVRGKQFGNTAGSERRKVLPARHKHDGERAAGGPGATGGGRG